VVLETLSSQTSFEKIVVRVANAADVHYAKLITDEMEAAATVWNLSTPLKTLATPMRKLVVWATAQPK